MKQMWSKPRLMAMPALDWVKASLSCADSPPLAIQMGREVKEKKRHKNTSLCITKCLGVHPACGLAPCQGDPS